MLNVIDWKSKLPSLVRLKGQSASDSTVVDRAAAVKASRSWTVLLGCGPGLTARNSVLLLCDP